MRQLKVFISYSWDSQEHRDWVMKLADDLDKYKEINVTWDGYDLDALSDKNAFMEEAVHGADYVLVIATNKYMQKANSRKGGVGIETNMAAARHWEEMEEKGESNFIILLREAEAIPRLYKGKLYISFVEDSEYQTGLNRICEIFKKTARVERPGKLLSLDSGIQSYAFTRVEDVIKINHKNRKQIVGVEEGTDFSGSNKIKYELWEASSPAPAYFLALFPNITISQTIERVARKFTELKMSPTVLTVLRSSPEKKGLLTKLFVSHGFKIEVYEYTIAEYIWTFCVDEVFKNSNSPQSVANYTDQAMRVKMPDGEVRQEESAREYFRTALLATPTPTAHIIIAPGGMGKTSLCLATAADLLSIEDKNISVVIIQAESLRRYYESKSMLSAQISTVYELYEFYVKSQGIAIILDQPTFELAVLCGKIVVVIDGLDELVSLLQEKFDLVKFLNSANDLHNELGCAQILITTRNGLQVAEDQIFAQGMVKYELLGFDDENLSIYAKRRFLKFPSREVMTKQLKKKLNDVSVEDQFGRVTPFVVDIVSTIIEEDVVTGSEDKFDVANQRIPYSSNNGLADIIVYAVMRREELRQQLGISAQQLVSVLSELVAEYGPRIPDSIVRERFEILFDTRAVDLLAKLFLNPLILSQDNLLILRYGFLNNYFAYIFLLDSIVTRSRTREFIKCLARLSTSRGHEFREIHKYFANHKREEFSQHAKVAIDNFKIFALSDDETSSPISEEAKRATSAIFRLYISINGLPSVSTDLLFDLFGSRFVGTKRSIKGIFVYGEFPPIDFSNLVVCNSKFVDYSDFQKGKFANSQFMYTIFIRCADTTNHDKSLVEALFDSSCDLGDLSSALQFVRDDIAAEDAVTESEVRKFFHSFFRGGHFEDQKIDYIKFSTRVNGLRSDSFDKLIALGYINMRTEKKDHKYYEISGSFRSSVYKFLSNNFINSAMRKFFDIVKR